jgi:hypothetical protein
MLNNMEQNTVIDDIMLDIAQDFGPILLFAMT